MIRPLALAVSLLSSLSAAAQEWRPAQRAMQEAFGKKDWKELRAQVRKLAEQRGFTPADVHNLALAEALNSDAPAALARLRELLAMGVIDEAAEPELAKVRALPEFAELRREMEKLKKPVSHAKPLLQLPAGLITEDVAYDARTGTYYVSSVRRRKIIALKPGGPARDFVAEGQHGVWGVFGLALDGERRALWATTAGVPQTEGLGKDDQGRTALLRFDLDSGKLVRGWELPGLGGPHLLGDLTVGAGGEVFASDTHGAVFRLKPGGDALETLVPRGTFGSPQTPAAAPGGKTLLVPDYLKGIAAVDLDSGKIRWLSHPREVALNGIDGLYFAGPALLAVQNGVRPARVVRLWPDAQLLRIERLEVIEASSEGLGEPTHGTLVGDDFVFIADSGWDRYGDDGARKKDAAADGAALWKTRALGEKQ